MSLCETEHCLYEILTISIEPGSPDDEMLVAELAYVLFSHKLRTAIGTDRTRGIRLEIWSGAAAVKHIVCRDIKY